MLEVYQTSAPGATPCLFETRTLKEQLEDLKSPLASLTDAFNFEKYRPQIIACIQRETTKQKIGSSCIVVGEEPFRQIKSLIEIGPGRFGKGISIAEQNSNT